MNALLRLAPASLVAALWVPGVAHAACGMGNQCAVVTSVTTLRVPPPPGSVVDVRCAAHDADGAQITKLTIGTDVGTFSNGLTSIDVPIGGAQDAVGTASWSTPFTPGVSANLTCAAWDRGGFMGLETQGPTFTQAVTLASGFEPEIVSLIVSPNPLFPGTVATAVAQASDPQGANLSYSWSATSGLITGDADADPWSVQWTAPNVAGLQTISLSVTNDLGVVTSSTVTADVQRVIAIEPMSSGGRNVYPARLAVTPAGEVFATDPTARAVHRFSASGSFMATLPMEGEPQGVAIDGSGNLVVGVGGRVVRMQTDGTIVDVLADDFRSPADVEFDATDGGLWVADAAAQRVRRFDAAGQELAAIETPGVSPIAIALSPGGQYLYVSDRVEERIRKYTRAGAFIDFVGTWGSEAGQVMRPAGLTVAPDGSVYSVDAYIGWLVGFRSDGSFLENVGTIGPSMGQLTLPLDATFDAFGRVLVANADNHRIEVFRTMSGSGVVCTADLDCDGMPDAWEVEFLLNPIDAVDSLRDDDGDGLSNFEEFAASSDPNVVDSDADGVWDGDEVSAGTDPADASDNRPDAIVAASLVSEPTLVTVDGAASFDPNGDDLTFEWVQQSGPVDVQLPPEAAPSVVLRTAGVYSWQLRVWDGLVWSAPVLTSVTIEDVAPTADAGPDFGALVNSVVTLDGALSADANGDPITRQWSQVAGPTALLATSDGSASFAATSPGVYRFRLTADDGVGAGAPDDVEITVDAIDDRVPVAAVPDVSYVSGGAVVSLDASASADSDGTELSYQWEQVGGPSVVLDDLTSSTPAFTAAGEGVYRFAVSVSDGVSVSAAAVQTIVVGEPSEVVVAAPARVNVGEVVSLDGSGTPGQAPVLTWTQVAGVHVPVTLDGLRATFTPIEPGAYIFEVAVADGAVEGLSTQVAVVVDDPQAGVYVAEASGVATGDGYVDELFALDASSTVSWEGGALTYVWTQVAGPRVILGDVNASSTFGTVPLLAEYAWELRVSDGVTRSLPALVTFGSVEAPCDAADPTLDADGDGVADGCDVCPGGDDAIDDDGDGVPNGCEPDTGVAPDPVAGGGCGGSGGCSSGGAASGLSWLPLAALLAGLRRRRSDVVKAFALLALLSFGLVATTPALAVDPPHAFAAYAVGTASFTATSANVTGVGTSWSGVMVGSSIKNNANGVWYVIAAVPTATTITLSGPAAATVSGAYTIDRPTANPCAGCHDLHGAAGNRAITTSVDNQTLCRSCHANVGINWALTDQAVVATTAGTAAFAAGSTTVTGTGTPWTAGMVGFLIKNDANGVWYRITGWGSATSLTISPASAAAAATSAYTINTGTGRHHRWDAVGVRTYTGSQLPLDAQLTASLDAGKLMCSTCHNQHSQTNPAFDPLASTAAGAAGRHLMRIANDDGQLCADCHRSRVMQSANYTGALLSHPVIVRYPGNCPVGASGAACTTCGAGYSLTGGVCVARTCLANGQACGNGTCNASLQCTPCAAGYAGALCDQCNDKAGYMADNGACVNTDSCPGGVCAATTNGYYTRPMETSGLAQSFSVASKATAITASPAGTLTDSTQTLSGTTGLSVRFLNAPNAGVVKLITASAANSITFSNAGMGAIAVGDSYEIDRDGNATNDIVLSNGSSGNVTCLSCHDVHNGDSNATTTELNPGAGDGRLLRRERASETCKGCHTYKQHNSVNTSTTYGNWGVSAVSPDAIVNCLTCHDPHDTPNHKLVATKLNYPSAYPYVVDFRSSTANDAFGLANTTNNGPCQVCHTKTKGAVLGRYRNTGNPENSHNVGVKCTSCHSHAEGFKGVGGESAGGSTCSACHSGIWNGMNGTTVVVSRHPIGNVLGTNDSFNQASPNADWATPTELMGVAAGSRSCTNMCHNDHPHTSTLHPTTHEDNVYTNATTSALRAADLRTSTDYANNATGGQCLSCHTKKVDAGVTPARPALSQPAYQASAHQYQTGDVLAKGVTWSYALHDASSFARNCTKCHSNEATPAATGTGLGAVHFSGYPFLLSGSKNPNGTQSTFQCYNCHGGGTLGADRSDKPLAKAMTVYSAGTVGVAVTGVVTGATTVWTAGMVGDSIMVATDTQRRRIVAFTSATSITVYPPPAVAITAGKTYTIDQSPVASHPFDADNTHDTVTEFNNAAFGNALGGPASPAGAARHASCLDCHDPHTAQKTARARYVTGNATFGTTTAVTGLGTTWTAAYVGGRIKNTANNTWYPVTAASATSITLGVASGMAGANIPYVLEGPAHVYTVGTATFAASPAVVGTGTAWDSGFVGWKIKGSTGIWYTVASVTNATNLTLTANATVMANGPYTLMQGNVAGEALEGSWGAKLSSNPTFWTDTAVGNFTKTKIVAGTDVEATLCFKCHTKYYWGAGTPPMVPSSPTVAETDVAKEFNPANRGNFAGTWASGETAGSYHPILATTYTSAADNNLGAITLTNLVTTNFPWSTTSRNLMTCTDCHESSVNSDPSGPHGSASTFLLRGPNTTWTNTLVAGAASMPAGTFCANCHSSSYASSRYDPVNGKGHIYSKHNIACMNCHAAIPHGGPRTGMLVAPAGAAAVFGASITGWDTTAPYSNPGAGSRLYLKTYPATAAAFFDNKVFCGCNGTGH